MRAGEPGGRAAGEGDKDVIGRSNHGVGGDGQPELSIQVASKAFATEHPPLVARNGLLDLAFHTQIPILIG